MQESKLQPPEICAVIFICPGNGKCGPRKGKGEISTTIAWQQSLVLSGASVIRRMPRPPLIHRSVGEQVYSHSRAAEPAAVASVASAASAGRVSAAVAVSVAGAAAPPVVVSPGWPVV